MRHSFVPPIGATLIIFAMMCSGAVYGHVHANTPSITSLVATPPYVPNNYTTTLSWNTTGVTGQKLMFDCVLGVTAKNTDGTSFPCGTRQSVGAQAASDSFGLSFTNVTGGTRDVHLTLYPSIDTSTDYDTGAASTVISVQPSFQPITNISITPPATSTTPSGAPITLSWTGVDASGVNVQIACIEGVKVFASPTATDPLPCGLPAFSSDLPISGNVTVYATNTTSEPRTLTFTVLPEIGGATYDATRSLSTNATIAPVPIPGKPIATSLFASAMRLLSNDILAISWSTASSTGANLTFSCVDGLTVYVASSTERIALPCGTTAFASPLPAVGSTTISISNSNSYGISMTITILPQDSAGAYYQTASRSLTTTIYPAGANFAANQIQPTTTPAIHTEPTTHVRHSYIFSRSLQRGSRNVDVQALQTFLALDASIYPEGAVSGYYGLATERAVKRFQKKYLLATQSDSGFGCVGPKTRTVLNTLTTP